MSGVVHWLEKRHKVAFFAIGIFGTLSCVPILFLNERGKDGVNDMSSYKVISSNSYAYSVVANLGYSIPLAMDVIFEFLWNRKTTGKPEFYSPFHMRLVICLTLLISSLLNVQYSICYPSVRATWAIINIRAIVISTIVMHQISFRYRHALPFCWWLATAVLLTINLVLTAYVISEESGGALLITIRSMRLIVTCTFAYSQLNHIRLILRGQFESVDAFQSIVFACLLLFTSCMYLVFGVIQFSSVNIYMFGHSIFLGFNYVSTLVLVVLSIIFNHEFRLEHALAQEKLSIKRMFVRYVSHEVRTPLNSCVLGLKYLHSILQKAAMSQEKLLDVDGICSVDGIVSEVEESCATAIDFLNNLLLYEKVDTMEMSLYPKAENLSAICRNAVKSFSLSALQLRIRLKCIVYCDSRIGNSVSDLREIVDFPSRNLEAFSCVDGPKIMVVLRNLISNALKFTPEGGAVTVGISPVVLRPEGIIMSIGSSSTSSGGGGNDFVTCSPCSKDVATHYRISVSDTGPGLSADEQSQLFQGIVQFSPNENQKGGGTGIGLYLSDKITKAHGSKIRIFSEGIKGRGSHFYMDFPKCEPESQSADAASPSPADSHRQRGPSSYHTNASAHSINVSVESPAMSGDRSVRASGGDVVTLVRASTLSPRPNCSPRTAHPFSCTSKEDLRVLVVDDSKMNRRMVIRALGQHNIGKVMDEAEDGVDLLRMMGVDAETSTHCKKKPPGVSVVPSVELKQYDVLLVDNSMPRMSGREAVSLLRMFGYSGLIVGLTGNALQEELASFCQSGADFALVKPLDMDHLIGILDEELCQASMNLV